MFSLADTASPISYAILRVFVAVMRATFLIYLCMLLGISSERDVRADSAHPSLRGYLSAHDPSTMTQCKDRYYIFWTGPNILSKSSADKTFWSPGPPVFTNAPTWTTNLVPGFGGTFWAPDLLFFNGQYHLYYAVSTFGSQVSAIGLATNPTLDPTDAAYHWTDMGMVIRSTNGSPYNTIDPCLTYDSSGNLWLAFGSYWSGIYLTQLDPLTGLRLTPNSPTYQLAYNSSIEASYIYRHGGYYYLFVNWGSCCSGVNSTYNIRVGRGASITGPYLDRDGVNMVNNGGTLFMRANGKFTGPGHVGIFNDGTNEWLTYHYYDANAWAPQYGAYGNADFDMLKVCWTADGWPAMSNDWSAVYNFDADAADENHQYAGLLQGGATIKNDPARGHVLDLNGTNGYVWLPPGVAYGQTFAAVVNWRGGGQWQRIFDFGFDTSKTVMLTPASGDNVLRCDINPGGNLQTLQWNRALPSNAWTHVAVTLDGAEGVLYVNGAAVATNTSMNLLPLNVAPQTNHLGRSKFSADPYFKGEYSSFRVYSRALSATEIVAPQVTIAQPTDGQGYNPGDSVGFAGSARDFLDVPISAMGLTWTVDFINAGVTNIVFGPTTAIASGTFTIPTSGPGATNGFYRILLSARDSAGHQATVAVSIFPTNTTLAAPWSSFYAFDTGPQDASNRFNGLLFGGATTTTDPAQGSVLNLSGSGQYMNLPAGAAAAQTIAGRVKWNGGNAWQRIFDFGRDSQHWFFLTPKDASGSMQCAITADAATYSYALEAPGAFPTNTWTQVAVVLDGRQGILYLNGQAVAVNNSLNLLPSDIAPTKALFGRSEFPADPYFAGQLDSILLASAPLDSVAIKRNFLSPTLSETVNFNTVTLSWPSWASAMQLYSSTNIGTATAWQPVPNQTVLSNGFLSVTLTGSGGPHFYRLQWP
jgi:arabinan endo-1,5-alpha-L-arabinosidase